MFHKFKNTFLGSLWVADDKSLKIYCVINTYLIDCKPVHIKVPQ